MLIRSEAAGTQIVGCDLDVGCAQLCDERLQVASVKWGVRLPLLARGHGQLDMVDVVDQHSTSLPVSTV
jgi:hypothetical protein